MKRISAELVFALAGLLFMGWCIHQTGKEDRCQAVIKSAQPVEVIQEVCR